MNTITSGVATSTLVKLDIDDMHMQLGYLGERDMFNLHKSNLLKYVNSSKLGFCK